MAMYLSTLPQREPVPRSLSSSWSSAVYSASSPMRRPWACKKARTRSNLAPVKGAAVFNSISIVHLADHVDEAVVPEQHHAHHPVLIANGRGGAHDALAALLQFVDVVDG